MFIVGEDNMLKDVLLLTLHRAGYSEYKPYNVYWIYNIFFDNREKLNVSSDEIVCAILAIDDCLEFIGEPENECARIKDNMIVNAIQGYTEGFTETSPIITIMAEKINEKIKGVGSLIKNIG